MGGLSGQARNSQRPWKKGKKKYLSKHSGQQLDKSEKDSDTSDKKKGEDTEKRRYQSTDRGRGGGEGKESEKKLRMVSLFFVLSYHRRRGERGEKGEEISFWGGPKSRRTR